MKKLTYIVVPNPLQGQDIVHYDYVGQFVTNGTTRLDALCEKIAGERPNLDAPTVKLVIKTLFAVIADGIAAENVRYNFEGISFESAISGSVPSMDSALSIENELYVLVSVGDPLRGEMALLTASSGDAEGASVKILNVEDSVTHAVGLVNGTNRVHITGKNISASQTGESLALVNPETLAPVATGTVVAEDGMGQRIDANFSSVAASGTYWMVLTTRGYATPDATPQAYRKKVEVLAPATAPTITNAQTPGKPAGTVMLEENTPFTITGTNLGQPGDVWWTELYEDGELVDKGNMTAKGKVVSATSTTVNLSGPWWDGDRPDGSWLEVYPNTKIVLVRGGVRTEFPMTFVQ